MHIVLPDVSFVFERFRKDGVGIDGVAVILIDVCKSSQLNTLGWKLSEGVYDVQSVFTFNSEIVPCRG